MSCILIQVKAHMSLVSKLSSGLGAQALGTMEKCDTMRLLLLWAYFNE